MYNETLALFDKNTVELMVEEQQEEIWKLSEEVSQIKEENERLRQQLAKLNGSMDL